MRGARSALAGSTQNRVLSARAKPYCATGEYRTARTGRTTGLAGVIALTAFYGYSAQLIATWCRVSQATARRWKRGVAAPAPALRLFTLHRDGKVLGTEWDGWRLAGDALIDPAGSRVTRRQLDCYVLVMQIAAEVTRGDPVQRERFHALLAQAS